MPGLNIVVEGSSKKQKTEKPRFIPKKERELLKKKEEEKEKKLKRQKEEETQRQRKQMLHDIRDHKRSAFIQDERGERPEDRERESYPQNKDEREREVKEKRLKDNKEKLVKDIKDTYLGRKKRVKRTIPVDHRQRFCFDWEPSEDTSVDMNELYSKKADVTLAFGRGYIAGVDRELQREKNTVFQEMLKRHKSKDLKTMKRIIERKEERIKRLNKKRLERKSQHHIWKRKKLEEMTDRDWRILKEDFNISTRGIGIYNPIRYWKETELDSQILQTLKKIGYKEPTPIQRMAIPIGLANRDIVGIAETGSGKTCAFILPMISYILKLPPMTPMNSMDGPYAIILAPSRELAEQIESETKRFSDPMGINTISIIGGTSLENQGMELRDGAEILIATPGRLMDCIERKYVVLNQCNYIVLDEADRMMDMGFEPQVIEIFDRMPSSNLQPENPDEIDKKKVYRQTIMFSATMPLFVEKLAKKYLRNPIFVSVGDSTGKASSNVRQNVVFASESEKRKLLQDILERFDPPIMIFCNHKKQCDMLDKFLNSQGYNCTVLHGGKSQDSRGSALKAFRDHDIDILVCTDVAGRGIDVKGVTHVINYDMPKNIEYYTHRIGRTGRAGAEGEATTFLSTGDEEVFYELKKLLIDTNNLVPPDLANHPAAQHAPGTFDNKPKVLYAV